MTPPLAYRDGAFLPAAELTVSYADAGFASGATVTDFCRAEAGELLRFDLHLARFRRDCAWLGVALPQTDAELTAAARTLLRVNAAPGVDLAVVTFATPGVLGYLAGRGGDGPPTVAMHTLPINPARYAFAETGAAIRAVGAWPTNELWPAHVKHRSRVGWHQAARHPSLRPGELPALLGAGGVADTPLGGVLYTRGDAIVAPPAGAVLDSVTLTILAETCRRDGVGWREEATDFRAVAAGTAGVDGVWLAGSGFGVAPVLRASWGESSADYPAGALVREVWGRRG